MINKIEELKEKYKLVDYNYKEAYKQIIINTFKENDLAIQKIRFGKNKDGIYIYHKLGTEFYQNCKEIIEETDTKIIYKRYKKYYNVSFIDINSGVDWFYTMLEQVISESLCRMKNENIIF